MARPLRFAIPIVLLSAMVGAPPAAASDQDIGAPYGSASSSATCFDSFRLSGHCRTFTAAADTTGDVALDLEVASRKEGEEPGAVVANASGTITATHHIATPVRAVLYVFNVRVHRAALTSPPPEVEFGQPGQPAQFQVQHNDVRVTFQGSASPPGCASSECRAVATKVVVSNGSLLLPTLSPQPMTLREADVQVSALLVNPSGGLLEGDVQLQFLPSAAIILADRGTASAELDATLTGIEVALPEPEVTVAPAFSDGSSRQSCSGSPLTSATCAAATDAATGDQSMDLSVVTPLDGMLPGSGSSTGQTSLRTTHDPGLARAVVYTFVLHADSAEAFATPQPARVLFIGRAESSVSASARANGPNCQTAACSKGATVVASSGPTQRSDEDVLMGVRIFASGDDLGAGSRELLLDVNGSAILENSRGSAFARLTGSTAVLAAVIR